MTDAPVTVMREGRGSYRISFVVGGAPQQYLAVAEHFSGLCATLCPEIVMRWCSEPARPPEGIRLTTIEFKDLLPEAGLPRSYLHIQESGVQHDGDSYLVRSHTVPLAGATGTAIRLAGGLLRLSPSPGTRTMLSYSFTVDADEPRADRRLALMIVRRMMIRVKEFMNKHANGEHHEALARDSSSRTAVLDLAEVPGRDVQQIRRDTGRGRRPRAQPARNGKDPAVYDSSER